jgi:hypothetical protein
MDEVYNSAVLLWFEVESGIIIKGLIWLQELFPIEFFEDETLL